MTELETIPAVEVSVCQCVCVRPAAAVHSQAENGPIVADAVRMHRVFCCFSFLLCSFLSV